MGRAGKRAWLLFLSLAEAHEGYGVEHQTVVGKLSAIGASPNERQKSPSRVEEDACYRHLPRVVVDALESFASANLNPERLDLFGALIESQFEPVSHNLLFPGREWMNLDGTCPFLPEEGREVDAKSFWCRVHRTSEIGKRDLEFLLGLYRSRFKYPIRKEKDASEDMDAISPFVSLAQGLVTTFADAASSWGDPFDDEGDDHPGDVAAILQKLTALLEHGHHWLDDSPSRGEARLTLRTTASIVLLAVSMLRNVLTFDPNGPDVDRLKVAADRFCRVAEIETRLALSKDAEDTGDDRRRILLRDLDRYSNRDAAEKVTPLDLIQPSDTPLTCLVYELVYSFSACLAELPGLRTPDTCEEFEDRWDDDALIHEFPKEVCFTPHTISQRDPRLKAFRWNDSPPIPLDLKLLKLPLPTLIDDQTRDAELLTYLAIWRAIVMQYYIGWNNWLDCPEQFLDKPRELVPGWRAFHVLFLEADVLAVGATESIRPDVRPWLILSENDWNPCEVLITVKGSLAVSDWVMDAMSAHAPMSNIPSATGFLGYIEALHPMLPVVENQLEKKSARAQCTCENLRLIIGGHSMGGGAGQLLASHLAYRYHQAGCNIRVDGVFYGSLRSMGLSLTDFYNGHVNGRNLLDDSDVLSMLPCNRDNSNSGQARCPYPAVGVPWMIGSDFYEKPAGNVRTNGWEGVHRKEKPTQAPSPAQDHEKAQLAGESERMWNRIQYDGTKAAKSFANRIASFVSRVAKLYVNVPADRDEIWERHIGSYACALSSACHGKPWSAFYWYCGKVNVE